MPLVKVTTLQTEIDLFEPEAQTMRSAIRDIAARVADRFSSSGRDAEVSPGMLLDSLEQFFDILQSTEDRCSDAQVIAAREMQDLGDYGVGLVSEMIRWADEFALDDEQQALQMITIPLSLLAIRRGFRLSQMEQLVNALSMVANNTPGTGQLAELAEIMDEVINAAAPAIKQDLDNDNPQRPWRLLNLNHAIVATRTHDPQIMEAAFQQLIYRLPDDAPVFFAEGMEQMDIIGYPQHVREIMEKYYQQTHKPTLH
jgi:hypothetical protein